MNKAIFMVVAACGLLSMQSAASTDPNLGTWQVILETKVRVAMSAPSGPGPFPAVILMHGCNGLGRATAQGMAHHVGHLLESGFITLVVDSFTARGIDTTCTSNRKMAEATLYRQFDALHAMFFLREQVFVDPENIFLVGLSQGGSVVAKLAGDRLSSIARKVMLEENPTEPWFRAIVAYYPWCPLVPKRLETPLLVLVGELDDWTPSLMCFWHKAVVRGAPYEAVIYDGAHHSFDLPIPVQSFAGHTVGGHPEAALQSRRRMVDWFRDHME